MTRKHFIAIASSMQSMRPYFASDASFMDCCKNMGYTLWKFNAAFDMTTFLAACDEPAEPINQEEFDI